MSARRARWLVAGAGALWGAVSFSVLWGYTAIQVHRSFVDSLPGLVSLLPVRLVLFGIRWVERDVVHRPFVLADNHQWIGLVAAALGAATLGTAYVVGGLVVRLMRAGGGRHDALGRPS